MKQQLSLFPPDKKKESTVTWYIYTDGASRGNPGQAGAGVYVITKDKTEVLTAAAYLGKKTNNQAEYLALVLALYLIDKEVKRRHNIRPHLAIRADSELLIKQIRGTYKVRNPHLMHLKILIDGLLEGYEHDLRHVRRESNTAADALANRGVDGKKYPPKDFMELISNPGA